MLARKDRIIADYEERKSRTKNKTKDRPLVKSLSILFDEDDSSTLAEMDDEDDKPCMLCHL